MERVATNLNDKKKYLVGIFTGKSKHEVISWIVFLKSTENKNYVK